MRRFIRMRLTSWTLLSVMALGSSVGVMLTPNSAEAVSQWSRKYGEPCSTCHAGFPRLNYYGERFKRNGYQDPDAAEPDGDTRGMKRINEYLVIPSINNWLGARMNVDAVKISSDSTTIEGKQKTQVTLGNPNWLQFFVAGTVFKNTSIFIENEFEQGDFKFTWYWLGFHNIADTTALNVQVGNVSPIDFTSYSNRLRITPALKGRSARIRSSNNQGDDSTDQSRARPGIQYYGYQGPVVWFAGIGTGSKGADPNDDLNYWGGVRLEVPESMESTFEGSSISFHAFGGTDACTNASAGAHDGATNDCTVMQQKNDFYRLTTAANIRYRKFDLQAMWVIGHDDNWNLTAGGPDADFNGFNITAQYEVNESWVPGVMFDLVAPGSSVPTSMKENRTRLLTPFVRYFIRDNFQLDLYAQIDLQKRSANHPDRDHVGMLNFRAMF